MLDAPIIAGAGLKSVWEIVGALRAGEMAASSAGVFLFGVIAAAVSGYFCIKFLLQYLQRHSIAIFTYYRWVLAALIVIVALVRM